MKPIFKHSAKIFLTLLIVASTSPALAMEKGDSRIPQNSENKVASTTVKIEKRVENRFDKMNVRFSATIDRLTAIMTRVNSRIEKIKNGGGNVTAAQGFVAQAKLSLDTASSTLASLQTASDLTAQLEMGTTTPMRTKAKTALQNLQKITKGLEKNLQDARNYLEKAVGSLMGDSELHATTTPTTHDTNH